jgi:hypothetical protein
MGEYSSRTMGKTFFISGSIPSKSGAISYCLPLQSYLESKGWKLTGVEDADILILFNHNSLIYKKFTRSGGLAKNAVLIRLEPAVVFPVQYKPRIERKYGMLISPGAVQTTASSEFVCNWPYSYNKNPSQPDLDENQDLNDLIDDRQIQKNFISENWESRLNKVVMIAANKVSPIKNSNYGIRRVIARDLTNLELDVFGDLWLTSLFRKILHRISVALSALKFGIIPNFFSIYGNLFRKYSTALGTILDKHKIMTHYRFVLVVENSSSYLSEKLLDALISGAIPIYIGPNLKKTGIPSDLAIQVTENYSKEVSRICKSTSIEFYKLHSKRTLKYLASKKFLDQNNSVKVFQSIANYIYRVYKEN